MDLKNKAGEFAADLLTDGRGEHYTHLAMSNWGSLGWGEGPVRDRIEAALRDVQRETAEECCKVLSKTSLSKFLILDVEFLEAIRARFNLETK